MSQSVRDLLDGAPQPPAVKTTAMRWLAPDSQAPCPVIDGGPVSTWGARPLRRCVAVGRHTTHQMEETR